MRPKKRILLIDVNETRRGWMRFTLQTAWYCKVQAAGNAAEARAIAGCWMPDAIVAMLPAPGVGLRELLDELHRTYPGIQASLAIAPRANAELEDVRATASLVNPPMSVMVEQLKVLTARKRGPQKGVKKPVQSVTPAELAERMRA